MIGRFSCGDRPAGMAPARGSTHPHYKLVTSTLTILSMALYVQALDPNTTTVIALTLPQTGIYVSETRGNEASEGYFPLSKALQSAMRLAADDVNAVDSVMKGSLSLALLEADTAMAAVKGLCDVMGDLGEIGVYGVGSFATKKQTVLLFWKAVRGKIGIPEDFRGHTVRLEIAVMMLQ